jgi:hypothetical protein
MNQQAILTYHSDLRIFDRVGGKKKGNQRIANKALTNGISLNETTGKLRRYLDKQKFQGDCHANNIMLYGNGIYLFDDNVLITVLTLPSEYCKIVSKAMKKKREAIDNV